MNHRVFTFFAEVDQINVMEQMRLISLWLDNWRDNGFDPYVISLQQTMKIPGAADYLKAVQKFHSSNPGFYDAYCFLRWWAVGKIGDPFSIMCDYDLFCYGWKSPMCDVVDDDIPGLEPVLPPLTCWAGHVPCLMSGPKADFLKMAMAFLKHPVVAGQHVSDMTLLAGPIGDKIIKKETLVREYLEDGWETAKVVHFPNARCQPAGKSPKWVHIPQLRKW